MGADQDRAQVLALHRVHFVGLGTGHPNRQPSAVKILPLADYGYFTVAVLVAGGIMIVSGPISSALLPRMARLQAEGQHDALIAVYRQATQLVAIIAIPAHWC